MLIPILDSDWSQISQEFNKNFEQMRFFRTEKQCKERWFNHLTNKYEISFKKITICCLESIGLWKKTSSFYQNILKSQINGQRFPENSLTKIKIK